MTDQAIPLDSQAVLDWFDLHGRHDLPWQQDVTPYRVWVSEIMLQQTQVGTVIPYFQRFVHRFPDVISLAAAAIDDVLHLWTGLGYYARARNLHQTARLVMTHHAGLFPNTLEALEALPGIGRSTAGAILSLSMEQRGVILDGNVKRVLCRYYAINEWPGTTAAQKQLWQLADACTPTARNAAYTQAMMDLGATVCTRSKPLCMHCPVASGCQALAQGLTGQLPAGKPRKSLPVREVIMPIWQDSSGRVLLQQRAASGIWGGLWSLPEVADEQELYAWLERFQARLCSELPSLRHTFSHFHLNIRPVLVAGELTAQINDSAGMLWYAAGTATEKVGLPAPVKRLLDQLSAQH